MDFNVDIWGEIKEYLIIPKKPSTIHKTAKIMREHIGDVGFCKNCSKFNLFVYLNYNGFKPFDPRPTNALEISIEYEDFWEPYFDMINDDSDDSDSDSE